MGSPRRFRLTLTAPASGFTYLKIKNERFRDVLDSGYLDGFADFVLYGFTEFPVKLGVFYYHSGTGHDSNYGTLCTERSLHLR
jgi:hypothetical protein